LYPKQIYDDANGYIKTMRVYLRLKGAGVVESRDLKETQARLTETIKKVSRRISLLANFRDCSTSPPGLVEDMDRLVFECNQLSNLANSLYRESRFTGSPILISPLGRIVSLNETISEADREKYMEQWPLYGATAEENNVSRKNLKEYNHLILTTNGLVDEPMRASMSKPMKELMNDRGKV
jgi:hypothetical protein